MSHQFGRAETELGNNLWHSSCIQGKAPIDLTIWSPMLRLMLSPGATLGLGEVRRTKAADG